MQRDNENLMYEPGDPRDECHYSDGDAVGSALIVAFGCLIAFAVFIYCCS